MKNFELLNSKDIKNLNKQLKDQFGNEFNFKDYVVFRTPKDRIYIINREFGEHDFSKIRINNVGLYFLSIVKDGLRLSIDGSQLFKAKKNILELDKKGFEKWMTGEELILEKENGYFLIKYNDDFLGCGKSTGNKILNYVPKARRVKF
jgi:NOL1/NOP2/fmu family ribosome biogenesis protein